MKKQILLLAFIMSVVFQPLYSQITIVSPWSNTLNSHTVSDGSNRLLIYVAAFESTKNTPLTSVSYGGQAMTQAVAKYFGNTATASSQIYAIIGLKYGI